jgi:hypothetical protein
MGGAESGELTKLYEGNLAVVWYRKIQALWPMSSVQGATGIVTGLPSPYSEKVSVLGLRGRDSLD